LSQYVNFVKEESSGQTYMHILIVANVYKESNVFILCLLYLIVYYS